MLLVQHMVYMKQAWQQPGIRMDIVTHANRRGQEGRHRMCNIAVRTAHKHASNDVETQITVNFLSCTKPRSELLWARFP